MHAPASKNCEPILFQKLAINETYVHSRKGANFQETKSRKKSRILKSLPLKERNSERFESVIYYCVRTLDVQV